MIPELRLPEEGRRVLEGEGVQFIAQDLGPVPIVTPESLASHVGEAGLIRASGLVSRLYELQINGVLYDDHIGNRFARHKWLGELSQRIGEERFWDLVMPYFTHNKIRLTNWIIVSWAIERLARMAERHDDMPVASKLIIASYRMKSQYKDQQTGEYKPITESLQPQLKKVKVFDQGTLAVLGILSQFNSG